MSKIFSPSPELIAHQLSPMKEFYDVTSSSTRPFPNYLLLMIDVGIQQSGDRLKLDFLDFEKVNGILNFDLPLILGVTIADQNLTWFHVDDTSSCSVLYVDRLELLGIQQVYTNLYGRGDLLAFNDSMTCPRGAIDLTLVIGWGTCESKLILNFLVIPCRGAFRGILGRPFLVNLYEEASRVYLKVTYHDMEVRPVIASADLEEARWIKELIREVILASTPRKENQGDTYTFDLDVRGEEIRPTPDGEFEPIQLCDNPMRTIKIWYGLPW